MACDLSSGFALQCRSNIGGLDSIFILSGSVSGITEASEGLISDIAGAGVFYEFQLPNNVGSYTETPTPSLENGTVFYSQVVEGAFHKLQSSIRNQVKVLAQKPDIKIIVKLANGKADGIGQYFYIGRYRGATLTGGAGTSGAAAGDLNAYALTFEALEPFPAFEIETTGGDLSTALTGITVG